MRTFDAFQIKAANFFKIIIHGIRSFFKHNCLNMAAAISFYSIFSLIPLLFLLFSLMGFILGTKAWLFDRIIKFVKLSLPYLSDDILEALRGLIAKWSIYGWIGIIVLIWSAEFVMLAIANAMNKIFGGAKKMGFLKVVKARLFAWGVFLIWSIAVLISIVITTVTEILSEIRIVAFGIDIAYYLEKSVIFKYFLPFIFMVTAVAFVFKMMAGVYISVRHAILGSVIFSVLWETAKYLFAWYITSFVSFNKIYGSVGALMILLLWIYYSAIIFLFSSELIASAKAIKGNFLKEP